MTATTWAKFYWSDWLSDPGLRRSSLAARGLWMDLLCIAAQHDPIGYLAVRGEALSISDIARMTGIVETDASTLVGELERNGVFSRDRKGTIYSRRMIRDAKRSAEGRKNKLDGLSGNKLKGKEKNPDLEGGLQADLGAQIPETRNQKEEKRRGDPEDIPRILRERELVDEPAHRSLIADLRNRGRETLTDYEKTFLNGIVGLKNITRKQREILDAIALKVGDAPQKQVPEINWETRLKYGRQFHQWPKAWGPIPNEPGCLAPPALVHPNDGFGWAEWTLAS